MGWGIVLLGGGVALLYMAGMYHKDSDTGSWILWGIAAITAGFMIA